MDSEQMCALWKCMIFSLDVTHEEVRNVFVQKRDYVGGRYGMTTVKEELHML